MGSNYYATLELNINATDADIKRAYRRLALKFHPTTNKELGSAEKFHQLSEAFDVLSDPQKKEIYDRFDEDGLKGGIPAEFCSDCGWTSKYVYHGNPDKTFRQFFGSSIPFPDFNTYEATSQPGAVIAQDSPIERDLHLTLDDLFHGCTKKIKISHRVMKDDGNTSSVEDKILSIDVQPGWREGTRVIFSKEGDQAPNSIPADIVFIVRQKSHPLFVRQDNDLIYKVQISLMMALTGFSVELETLDGKLLSIPINDIVNISYRKVVTGEGMPLAQNPSQRGDLIISFDIQFPEKLSAESKQLIKKALIF